jgi:hypothetical protein
MALLTQASPAQIAAFHHVTGADVKLRKPKPEPQFVQQYARSFDGGDFELQLPMIIHAQHGYAKSRNRHYAGQVAAQHKERVLLALRSLCRDVDRTRIGAVTLTRVSIGRMDDDNLRAAFKNVKDAVAAWIVNGETEFERANIGRFDGQLDKQTGAFQWHYAQSTNDENVKRHPRKKPQGIRIRLHLR